MMFFCNNYPFYELRFVITVWTLFVREIWPSFVKDSITQASVRATVALRAKCAPNYSARGQEHRGRVQIYDGRFGHPTLTDVRFSLFFSCKPNTFAKF
jgi:hypothetical protein